MQSGLVLPSSDHPTELHGKALPGFACLASEEFVLMSLVIQILSFFAIICVTLAKLFTISVTQFIHLLNGDNNEPLIVFMKLLRDNMLVQKMLSRMPGTGQSWNKELLAVIFITISMQVQN